MTTLKHGIRHGREAFQGAGGVLLQYQTWHPAGPPAAIVVGVHGHGDHNGGLYRMIEHLVAHGYAWYGPDLRGHGRSAGARGYLRAWSDFRDDLALFLRVVKSREKGRPIFLLGHSLGGLICLDFAIRRPEELDGIVAVSPALDYTGIPVAAKVLLKAASAIRPDYALESRTDYAKLTRDIAVLESLAADPLRHGRMSAGLMQGIEKTRRWVAAHAADLRIPLLMLYGLDDRITPASAAARFFRSVSSKKELHEYAHARHRPFDDLDGSVFLADLLVWMQARSGTRSPANLRDKAPAVAAAAFSFAKEHR